MAFVSSSPIYSGKRPHRRSSIKRTRWQSCAQPKKGVSELREYERYLTQVAKTSPPPYLDGLLHALSASSTRFTPPSIRTDLHPFLIPLVYDIESEVTTGLLRWPTPPDEMDLPIVQSSPRDPSLKLIAPSAKSYVTRQLASADFAGNYEVRNSLRSACSLALAYQNGDVDQSGVGLERFLILKVGPFPDIYEGLVEFHKAKGDTQSALITCERSANAHPGWGRAHAFHANFLRELGREMEARDAARFCLQMPLWTIGSVETLLDMASLAGYEDSTSLCKIYKRLYEDDRKQEIADGKAPQQVALDRAAYLLDVCFTDGSGWESIKEDLAALYDEADMPDFATFVRY
ncbi:hypothetical protein BWQ96_04195 [Gracilariopsis chorda]|uniref:Uncharacterized protein n=1 Tax=Gracilariopsis chorda TaxID=448386 RepID=A0A2V3IY10_9FLOR|nr:hypothetical protein BWQ96_04195 [Gracilariopsis chorda]|eukprot:PXF46020.1 hypothetical protein BWQ96_04195 [Gracilariopsis chorda]